MEILELLLKHYGKFENHRIELKPGINIIYGGNETGKTTIHSFIRAMFFGLGRGRGKASRTDEYQVRQPWETPGAFTGSMRVRSGGQIYRIDRCFDRSTRPLQVTCETEAWEAEHPSETLGQMLGGISETAFVNTVFVRQARCETDEALARELQHFMVNSDSSLDGGLDVAGALQSLRRKKKQFEQKQKKEEEQLETKIAQKQARAEEIRGELERLREQAAVFSAGRGNGRSAELFAEEDWPEEEQTGDYGGARRLLEILLFLAGLLSMAGTVWLEGLALRIFLGIFSAVFFVLIFVVHFFLGEKAAQEEREEERTECPPYLLEEIRNREEIYQKLQDELESLYHNHVKVDSVDIEIAALTQAIDRICSLSDGIYRESGGQIGEAASRILEEITGGRYRRIVLDDLAEVRIHTPSRVLGLHQVSGGTMQQIYFALRMAAGEVLSGGVALPVVLDETFAMYDDQRLEAVMRWLKRSGRQVILFTCQKREREILERL